MSSATSFLSKDLPSAIARAARLSRYARDLLCAEPELAHDVALDAPLDRAWMRARIEGRDHDDRTLKTALRRLRKTVMLGLITRDLDGRADLAEVVDTVTALAEETVAAAAASHAQWLAHEFGNPLGATSAKTQQLHVIAMGKLGGGELNVSSDIDIVFAYPEDGETDGTRRISNHEFFVRLARRIISAIAEVTADGFVFRVDTRLRPYGDSGPLAVSFDMLEEYFVTQGREWERYAWVKARPVTGEAGADLDAVLTPFVYRRHLDYSAIASLRSLHAQIRQEVQKREIADNIKLGPGGIREVEFFGQIFQLIRGGVTPDLQERGIRKVLAVLAERGTISEDTRRELDAAYVFLRNVEHRLQEAADQQTHDVPREDAGMARLAAAMGFDTAASFTAALDGHRHAVHGHFQMLLEAPEAEGHASAVARELDTIWTQAAGAARAAELLAQVGYEEPGEVLRLLDHLRSDTETRALSLTGRQRLDRLIPLILREATHASQPLSALRRILDLVRTVERRTSYLALLLEYPAALRRLVKLADASPWIASFLAQHPVLLDELLDSRTLYRPPDRDTLAADIRRRLAQAPADDLESQIEELCIFKQSNVLRVAAADVTGRLPLMRVSDFLSDIAEIAVNAVVDLAWDHLVERHGTPVCRLDGRPCERGFAVIAYGKLGGLELGYGSDLDLVFLHAGVDGPTRGGPRPIDTAQFFNRLGQRVIHILTSHTRAGKVYEIDTRLRPSGISGILVRHVEAFGDYQLNEAWTWEHQALIKARAVSGEALITARFDAIRGQTLARRRESTRLRADVIEMRERMRREHSRPAAGVFDLKQDPGGMVDIEFLVQYLVLRLAQRHPELVQWTDNVRLIQTLIGATVLNEVTAHVLKHAYLIYRAAAHQLSLQAKPATVPAEKFDRLQQRIRQIWKAVFQER